MPYEKKPAQAQIRWELNTIQSKCTHKGLTIFFAYHNDDIDEKLYDHVAIADTDLQSEDIAKVDCDAWGKVWQSEVDETFCFNLNELPSMRDMLRTTIRETKLREAFMKALLTGEFERVFDVKVLFETDERPHADEAENTNCLVGFRCPACGSTGPFDIVSTCWAEVHDDGIHDTNDHEWSDTSKICCKACTHSGFVKQFKLKQAKRKKT